jgi:hypothetical protein
MNLPTASTEECLVFPLASHPPSPAPASRSKRRRPASAMRTILIVAAIVGTLLTAALFYLGPTIDERLAVRSLRQLGYKVVFFAISREGVEGALGRTDSLRIKGDRPFDDDAMAVVTRFGRVRELILLCKNVEPGALRRVGELPSLRSLAIEGSDVNDRSIEGIGSAANVEILQISYTAIRGPGLSEIALMKGLRELDLRGNKHLGDLRVSDLRGLGHVHMIELQETTIEGDCLGWLPDCDVLSLEGSTAGDDTLRGLSRCTRLRCLYLSQTRVTGGGIKYLAPLENLKSLTLANCPISDESLGCIQSLKGLRALNLRQTPISDEGLDRLSAARQLDEINLDDCKRITAAGVDRLRQTLSASRATSDSEPFVSTNFP